MALGLTESVVPATPGVLTLELNTGSDTLLGANNEELGTGKDIPDVINIAFQPSEREHRIQEETRMMESWTEEEWEKYAALQLAQDSVVKML